MLKGSFTLLTTPFREDGSLDEEGLRKLARFQLDAGVHGISPLGVTGENPSLTDGEVARVIEILKDEIGNKILLIPDTCANSVAKVIERVKLYGKLGCDYISVYTPFLVMPTQQGMINFFKRAADASEIPLILHDDLKRVGVVLSAESIAELAEHPNIIGIKEGVKNIDHLLKIILLTRNKNFSVFTGKDTTLYPLLCIGGMGNFAVAGNVVPEVMKSIIELYFSGKKEEAEKLHFDYMYLFEALRWETNPMGVKEAMNQMGLPAGPVRIPLTRLSKKNREALEKILKEKGLFGKYTA